MYRRFGKRVLDLCVTLIAAVPAVLLCLVCIIAIRRDSEGPAIFRQVRIGRGGKAFVLYKLRTMSLGTGDIASHEVAASQVTSVGRILRSTKLDELPQLLNVIRGDMSLVGPRPCLPSQTELIKERVRRGAFDIRPGITGAAQLDGIDMSDPQRLAVADAAYVARLGLREDLILLARTALGKGRGDAIGLG